MSPRATAIAYGIAGVCIVLLLRHIVRYLQGLDDHLTEMIDIGAEEHPQ